MSSSTAMGDSCKPAQLRSVVLLAATPLLGDGRSHVQHVRGNVVQVRLLHGLHLGPNVSATDGRVHLRDVLETIVSGGVVLVVHQGLDVVSWWRGALELLDAEPHVLVGPSAAANVACGASIVEKPLAAVQALLGQHDCLAFAIHWNQDVVHVSASRACRSSQQEGTHGSTGQEARGKGPAGRLLGSASSGLKARQRGQSWRL
mmetsp:Transcript_87480/g.157615  ORF Transcript_87480/g.157615 Transcript_87480/m.157615 type:complete len:203 (+) Transcript_87480:59-667(+)